MSKLLGTWGLIVVLLGVTPACKDEQACHKARTSAANAWQKIRDDAGRFKLQGTTGYEDYSPAQKTTHFEAFKAIEEQSGLVFESFAFQKISWSTGEKARDRVVKAFDGYFDKSKYTGFKALLDAGLKRFNEAEAACR